MNIHVTSEDPKECARFLDNVRVNKMLTETVQMITNAWWFVNHPQLAKNPLRKKNSEKIQEIADKHSIMKPTHVNHPCSIWTRECRENIGWMIEYAFALFSEFESRFDNPKHRSVTKLSNALVTDFFSQLPKNGSRTPFANCAKSESLGIDHSDNENVFEAYQLYLNDRWDLDKREPIWTRKREAA